MKKGTQTGNSLVVTLQKDASQKCTYRSCLPSNISKSAIPVKKYYVNLAFCSDKPHQQTCIHYVFMDYRSRVEESQISTSTQVNTTPGDKTYAALGFMLHRKQHYVYTEHHSCSKVVSLFLWIASRKNVMPLRTRAMRTNQFNQRRGCPF